MKLTPLTDFVLENLNPENFGSSDVRKVIAYTKFLKQPLTLGMFVPVDEEGSVLKFIDLDSPKYFKMKEKVLFEGWTHEDRYGWVQNHELGLEINTETGTLAIFHENGIGYGYVKNIEDLVSYALTLTPSALEAIGIKE